MPDTRIELQAGRLVRAYASRPANVADLLHASFAGAGEATAIVDGARRVSYRELSALAGTVAANLAAAGVRAGDRVAVMLPNGLDAMVSVVAIAWLGAVIVPIGTRLKRPEISHIFGDSEPVAVVYAPEFAPELPSEGPALRLAAGSAAWARLDESQGAPLPTPALAQDDLFGILYTSGTTGRPKGAMLTHFNVVHSCLHWPAVLGLGRGERTVLCIPWSHVAGLCGVVLPFLAIGATLAMMAEFKRREFLQLAQAERITHALMVPAMYGLCLLEPDLASFDLGSWRLGVYGSAPMPEPTIRRFAEAFPQLQMCNAYGATETTSPTTIMPPGDGVAHSESIGRVVPCGDIRVMDEQGRELPPGEEGELWIGGPMVVPGYWRNPQADADAFAGGYWKSGDIGAIDAQGYVRIADRKKDMINRGGYKVYPAEVENVLTGLAGVVEAAVVGRPDDILGELVVAFLNVNQPLDAAQVRAFCAERMADYKVPGRVVIGQQPLPRNANGKIQKADLRRMALELPAEGGRA
ncbi:class I adenylate-forming enzyme family protein [Ramlibacter sp. MAHUQ-53]|uniref:class I adenylate-forming enzyme family protein n=1 Tax=unclassified Ramlibacter TaxID=2617605 RepID=UPI00362DB8AC